MHVSSDVAHENVIVSSRLTQDDSMLGDIQIRFSRNDLKSYHFSQCIFITIKEAEQLHRVLNDAMNDYYQKACEHPLSARIATNTYGEEICELCGASGDQLPVVEM